MSAVEYTRCDNPGCGRVTSDLPDDAHLYAQGWARVTQGCEQWDLCPDCAKKALEAVGIEVGK